MPGTEKRVYVETAKRSAELHPDASLVCRAIYPALIDLAKFCRANPHCGWSATHAAKFKGLLAVVRDVALAHDENPPPVSIHRIRSSATRAQRRAAFAKAPPSNSRH